MTIELTIMEIDSDTFRIKINGDETLAVRWEGFLSPKLVFDEVERGVFKPFMSTTFKSVKEAKFIAQAYLSFKNAENIKIIKS